MYIYIFTCPAYWQFGVYYFILKRAVTKSHELLAALWTLKTVVWS